MDCNYHQESMNRFIASAERVNWDKCCDVMGCFYFHPNVNPEFLDEPKNAAYIKKHTVFSRRNLTKSELDKLNKKREL